MSFLIFYSSIRGAVFFNVLFYTNLIKAKSEVLIRLFVLIRFVVSFIFRFFD